jgi:phosphohistidine phosphatase
MRHVPPRRSAIRRSHPPDRPGGTRQTVPVTARRLCLVRHAEAAPALASDADRPLTERGAADAAGIGQWLAERGITPDAVVVSSALRTRQTWERLAAALPGAPQPDLDPRLYRNTLDGYLDVVRDTDAAVAVLLLVGHAPSVAGLAADLLGGPAPGFPPGGRALLAVTVDWGFAGPGTATLLDAAVP